MDKNREEEPNKKLVKITKNELGKEICITLDERRSIEVTLWKNGHIRVALNIGSETIWIDEEVKGREYDVCGTSSSGGYSAGAFHVGRYSTTFIPTDIPDEGVKRGLFGEENKNILVWRCIPEFRQYKEELLREEKRLNLRIPHETSGNPYGWSIACCLYYDYCGEPCKTGESRKLKGDMYEYWTLLMLLELLLRNKKEETSIKNSPCSYHVVPKIRASYANVFIRPPLPSYNKGIVISRYHLPASLINFLNKYSYSGREFTHGIPDILISDPDLEDLPDPFLPGAYNLWEEIHSKIKLFIECKAGKLNTEDVSRIFWYSLAYNVPIALFSQEKANQGLKDKIELFRRRANLEIYVFEEFRIGERQKWLNALSNTLFGRDYPGKEEED